MQNSGINKKGLMADKPTYEELERELSHRKTLEQGCLLFIDSSTEGFGIYDAALNLIEINNAAMGMLPTGTQKKEILGKNMTEFAPFTKRIGHYKKFEKVVKTGLSFSVDDSMIKKDLGEERHFHIEAFKVGDGLGLVAVDITDKKLKERELKKRESQLEAKAQELDEMNSALKVLLRKRDEDKREIEEKIMMNMNELVMPQVKKLKMGRISHAQKVQLDLLEKNLKDIISSFIHRLFSKGLKLTTTEYQVAKLILQGEDTKGIAEILCCKPRTIEFHRANLRKKIGLKNKKISLKTFFSSIN